MRSSFRLNSTQKTTTKRKISFSTNIFVLFSNNLFADKDLICKLHKPFRRARRNKDSIHINGYRFVIASQSDTTTYLKCANFRNKCFARASKRKDTGETFITKANHTESCIFNSVVDCM